MDDAYPVIETIEERRSVRTFENRSVDPALLAKIEQYIKGLTNPFGADVRVDIVHKSVEGGGEKVGTYGVIKGASTFLCLTVAPGERALLGAGFAFEDLILYVTSLGLGTVWLGVTFTRSKFQSALNIPADYLFPAVSPIGYPAGKRLAERVMRMAIGADRRKPWRDIFFNGDFYTPLEEIDAGRYATALEMLRLAPSATNSQPWRVLKVGDTFHFFETHKAKASAEDKNFKQIDLGIATFHFFKTLQSEGIEGAFVSMPPQDVVIPANFHYVTSFTAR